eukprot:snap_masked-scaffold_36-processed-gene-2.50-mRNA-1 protein AED:1.00 eAED:1.00 QI:0/-1/0/0/-1/1/1/0/129
MEKLSLTLLEKSSNREKEFGFCSYVGAFNDTRNTEEAQRISVYNLSTSLPPVSIQYEYQNSPQKRKDTLEMKLFKNSSRLESLESRHIIDISSENVEPKKRKDPLSYPEPERKRRRLVRRNAAPEDKSI